MFHAGVFRMDFGRKIKIVLSLLRPAELKNTVKMFPRLMNSLRQSGVRTTIAKVKYHAWAKNSIANVAQEQGQVREQGAALSLAQSFIGNAGVPADSYQSFYEDDVDFSKFTTDIKALAFYLPQFHTFPENDEWWGKGFTEWTNTRKAQPQFPSHYQPREPHDDIGYYDLSDYRTLQRQADMMKKHGIYGLCMYHYWFSGKRLMEKPLDLLIEHPEIDLKFCLCWANENWTKTWDGLENHILISQKHQDDDIDYIKDLKKYIMDPRYIRVNGKPLVLVYRPGVLPDASKTFRRWRKWAMKNGIGPLHLLVVRGCANTPESMLVDGADGEVEFPPAYTAAPIVLKNTECGGQIMHYPGYVNEIISGRGCTEKFDTPVYRGAMLGWDCTPRRKAYHCWYGFSPQWYYKWLRYNIEWTRKHHEEEDRFIFINAWNEWAEGTYLEPDKLFGYTNLNTTSRALFGMPLITGMSDFEVNSSSPYYNEKWYVETYQDIALSGMNPLIHFTMSGWKEGRSPSEHFPNALYIFFNRHLLKGETCTITDFLRRNANDHYLAELCKKFDELQRQTREKMRIKLFVPQAAEKNSNFKNMKTAVHLHCFYADMVPEICEYLKSIPCDFDLFVSVPEGNKDDKKALRQTFRKLIPRLNKCRIKVCQNRGRDIAPLICTFGKDLLEYDYFCHIHTKKSLHTKEHAPWANFIFDHLFGDEEWCKRVFQLLADGAAVVYPPDFLMMKEEPSGWGSNITFAQQVLTRFEKQIDLAEEFPVIEFPQGSMFWANVSAMKSMLTLDLAYEDFMPEPLGTDGSIAHALERLFFIWCLEHKSDVCQIFKDDERDMIERKRYWYTPLESRTE